MNKNARVGFQSAILVNKFWIAVSFGLSLIAWWLGADALAILLLTLSAVALISYLWGMAALKNLKVTVKAQSSVLSVGQSVLFSYHIENDKMLPLVWMEICQDVPKNDCLKPDASMTLREFTPEEAEHSGREKAYMRRFAFLMGHSEITWECIWTGCKRGVYRPKNIAVRSGDGFGLTQSVGEYPGLDGTCFVIWPRIIPVNIAPILQRIRSGRTGRKGWAEDVTVLRDEREYQPGDSWKRIDWRVAARTQELYTRQYEMVKPQSVLLAVESSTMHDPEDAFSLAASILWELSNEGVSIGLALPATAQKEAVVIRPDDPSASVEDCLFELADHDEKTATAAFALRSIAAFCAEAGQIWIIGEDQKSICAGNLASALAFASPGIITAAGDAGLSFDGIKTEPAGSSHEKAGRANGSGSEKAGKAGGSGNEKAGKDYDSDNEKTEKAIGPGSEAAFGSSSEEEFRKGAAV